MNKTEPIPAERREAAQKGVENDSCGPDVHFQTVAARKVQFNEQLTQAKSPNPLR